MGVHRPGEMRGEERTFSVSGGGSGTQTVSFENTYRNAMAEVGIAGGAALLGTLDVKFTGWNRDANGNIIGMDILYDNSDTTSHDAVWTVSGVTV